MIFSCVLVVILRRNDDVTCRYRKVKQQYVYMTLTDYQTLQTELKQFLSTITNGTIIFYASAIASALFGPYMSLLTNIIVDNRIPFPNILSPYLVLFCSFSGITTLHCSNTSFPSFDSCMRHMLMLPSRGVNTGLTCKKSLQSKFWLQKCGVIM